MSTTPPDLRRVSLRAAPGTGAACTTAAFGTGNQPRTGDPSPGVGTGYFATLGHGAALREGALSTACRFLRDSRATDAEAAARTLRDSARVPARGRR